MEINKEDLNTAVFTTKYILEKSSPILHVYHNIEDGAWEFIGSEENINEEDYRVVSLDEIIQIDNSVIDILDLPLGGEAHRAIKNAPWKIVSDNN
jgi:hypothetical protein